MAECYLATLHLLATIINKFLILAEYIQYMYIITNNMVHDDSFLNNYIHVRHKPMFSMYFSLFLSAHLHSKTKTFLLIYTIPPSPPFPQSPTIQKKRSSRPSCLLLSFRNSCAVITECVPRLNSQLPHTNSGVSHAI